MPPPSGPRSSRNSTPTATRGASRGGIQKRRAPVGRVDKDGDLVMDAAGGGEPRKGGKGRQEGTGSRSGATRASGRAGSSIGTARGNLVSQRSQQAILRGLGNQDVNLIDTRRGHGGTITTAGGVGRPRGRDVLVHISVHGFKQSKAASNPDGGVKDLLGFLERKATAHEGSTKSVKVKKVCQTPRWHCQDGTFPLGLATCCSKFKQRRC